MATKLVLSPIQTVDLRDCWDHEALDFTPWLANNITLLGEAVGMELELVGTEQSVGSFNADILCKNTGTDEWVLVENQLEGTDHSHLGQLLTYTAGLHAKTIIWVARRFREEHRAALDWLNENTVPEVRFFGLEMQLWRIGNSGPVAPRFNIVCQPNNYSKTLTAQKDGAGTGAGGAVGASFRLHYWTAMMDRLKSGPNTPLKPPAPRDQNWFSFGLGRSGFNIDPVISQQKKWIRVELYLHGPNAKKHLFLLQNEKAAIEQTLGELQWEELPTKQDARIALYQANTDPMDEAAWPEQHDWLIKHCLAFYNTFRPLVLALQVPKDDGLTLNNMDNDATDA